MIFKYEWNQTVAPIFAKVDAQVVGERLEKLKKKHGGSIDKVVVLNDARDPKSPLHDLFTWDDRIAAEKQRLREAGRIIQHIRVHIVDDTDKKDHVVSAFVRVQRDEDKKPTFIPVQTAFADPMLREQVLGKAHRELQAWRNRYAGYEELSDIFEAIDAYAVTP